jgi:hypothetical protein
MSNIAEIVARGLYDNPRLKLIPPAILEDVEAAAFFRLEIMLDNDGYTQDIGTLLSEDVVQCEGCSLLVFPTSPGRVYDVEDGITLCASCAEVPNGNP